MFLHFRSGKKKQIFDQSSIQKALTNKGNRICNIKSYKPIAQIWAPACIVFNHIILTNTFHYYHTKLLGRENWSQSNTCSVLAYQRGTTFSFLWQNLNSAERSNLSDIDKRNGRKATRRQQKTDVETSFCVEEDEVEEIAVVLLATVLLLLF